MSIDFTPAPAQIDFKPAAPAKMSPAEKNKGITDLFDSEPTKPLPPSILASAGIKFKPSTAPVSFTPATPVEGAKPAEKPTPIPAIDPDLDPTKHSAAHRAVAALGKSARNAVGGIVDSVSDAAKLPGDVTAGKYNSDRESPELADRTFNMAQLVAGGDAGGKVLKKGVESFVDATGRKFEGTPGYKELSGAVDAAGNHTPSANPTALLNTSKIFSADQPTASTQPLASERGVSDRLFQQQGASLADQQELAKWLQTNIGNAPKQLGEKFLDHADDPKGVPLEPHEQVLYDSTIKQMEAEINANREEMGRYGLDSEELHDETGSLGGAIRQRVGMNTPLDRVMGIEAKPVESSRSLSKSAGTFKGRNMMALTGEDGSRKVVHIGNDGTIMDAADKGKKLGTYDEEGKQAIIDGKPQKLGEATRKEIEEATNGDVAYHKNAFGVYGTTLLQTRRAVRSARLLEEIKKDPSFSEVAVPVTAAKGKAPVGPDGEHWRQVSDIPAFKDYYFAPRYAEELEDFAHGLKTGMGQLNKLDALNRFSLNLLFFANPYHAYNVAEMALVTKGAGGLLKDLPGTAKDFASSVKDVALLRKPYMKYARAGVPLPGMKDAAEQFSKATMQAMGESIKRNPKEFGAIARELFGDTSSAPMQELVKRMAEVSHKAVFQFQDVLQMTLQKGLERKGKTTAEATEQIAKTFPNYRTPARVADQRWLGQALRSQAFFNFPKYMYNRFAGMGNMLKDLTGPERAKAIDQILTIGLLYYAGSTIVDPFLKQMTGNKNAEASPFGYGVFPEAIDKLANGKRTVGQTFQSFTSPGYVPQAYDMARGVNAYLAKPTSIPGESASEVGKDYLNEMAQKLSPVQRFGAVDSGKMKPEDELWQQLLGVKYPGELPKSVRKQLKTREKYGTPLENDVRSLRKKITSDDTEEPPAINFTPSN